MAKKLFLLDGMALAYRAHFALIARPIFNSKGENTSALHGFTQTLLDILKSQNPTHLAVVFDTDAPTQRHIDFKDYKADRQSMPEELSAALPHIRTMLEAFNIPVISCDGYEADDLIGTLACRAASEGFVAYMVTPDKDFGQLVSEHILLYKPSRMGEGVEVLGVEEIKARWGIQEPRQLIDILGLWGDAIDNIPGVPGIGEKTASKLISEFGSIENLLANTDKVKGKLKEKLETFREQALLSKKLATIICDAPCGLTPDELVLKDPNEEELKKLFIRFEFNSIGRRLFGDEFKAGRGFSPAPTTAEEPSGAVENEPLESGSEQNPVPASLKSILTVPHNYRLLTSQEEINAFLTALSQQKKFAFTVETDGAEHRRARILGVAFSTEPHVAVYIEASPQVSQDQLLESLRPVLESDQIEKIGHDLKTDLAVLKWNGLEVAGKLFDSMIAHSLVEPEIRHSMDYLAEAFLGYTPLVANQSAPEKTTSVTPEFSALMDASEQGPCEYADLAWQLHLTLEPMLQAKSQTTVFYQIESPLTPVLVDMEFEGIRIDAGALSEFRSSLNSQIREQERAVFALAAMEFNLSSPRQLGDVLFDVLKLDPNAKKTKTGQYSTDEQTLLRLADEHEIVRRLMDHRVMTKLLSTYVDALPAAVFEKTGRIHTTYNQVATTTGRLNSQNPNLQNIPIRTEKGREIRKAFVPRGEGFSLLSADYSQIELRIIAAITQEKGLLEAFEAGHDIHTATAARVFGVTLEMATPEMRRKAKMVNFGIAYGISAFGLAQRLGIPRKEAAAIIGQYFTQFPGIQKYMQETVEFARKHGFVETVTGRRRYLREIRSSNATVRGSAERNAINAPIQGTAADMIKLAMISVHQELKSRRAKTRMLLQVHDELVFDLHDSEKDELLPMIGEKMRNALPLKAPIVVEMGTGENWLAAH